MRLTDDAYWLQTSAWLLTLALRPAMPREQAEANAPHWLLLELHAKPTLVSTPLLFSFPSFVQLLAQLPQLFTQLTPNCQPC